MRFVLGAAAAAAGYRLAAFDSIGSTNDEALVRARAGDPGRLWVVTAHQWKGRGRRGRTWQTPVGNLGASLLLVGPVQIAAAASLGFVAGLALSDALSRIAPRLSTATALDGAEAPGGTRFELKWPNDVLAGGAKLAGIMLESEALPGGVTAIVIGIGVNVAASPVDVPYPATSLADLGIEADAGAVFAALSDAWVVRHAQWDGGRGLAAVRADWLDRAAGLGGSVAVRVGERIVRGTFETLNEDGCLVVATEAGERISIAAGEVHFGTVASLGTTS
ncbi:BirA family biotin operon repressor/biotin-[acetyl-CoA-carboxylase] ligase [Tepidamorphus gemmatus]|uniref:biotin--[biotin carboxyl-carrier protein] ligase n=1 Tax=Tepidamorphus gemmatus TaxID=747076 RepID=A0A4R3MG51_9HYPH|nr:biotin--[acetyl-CoA-carboxylase] ligase [Tepidamorphus gemmatus]TCT11267.1 BirA family biotin operon repressor/biotin-[acetyl-CoA-carboxylase] ligase [Tepidamorphus gemmatus]